MDRFADRRVIVTGAGSGIGQATVARLLAHPLRFDVPITGQPSTASR